MTEAALAAISSRDGLTELTVRDLVCDGLLDFMMGPVDSF